MRIVVALGGNALLRRGEPMTAEAQRENIRIAARALAPLSAPHELVVSHGNGPQVGLLALQSAAYEKVEAYPLDVLGAETEGMIGYMIEQELGNLLPFEQPFATVLTMVEVDPADPGVLQPHQVRRARVRQAAGGRRRGRERLGVQAGRAVLAPGGALSGTASASSRSVPSAGFSSMTRWSSVPEAAGCPPCIEPGADRVLVGVEAVIDKDLASELLARELEADLYVMATDVDGVYLDWGTPAAAAADDRHARRAAGRRTFAAGSMGPKVEAACRFVERTGKRAAIGALPDIEEIVAGTAGTNVVAG